MKVIILVLFVFCWFTAIMALPQSQNRPGEVLIFSDDFNTLNLNTWKHDITLSGGGNWEFQLYHNNRTNSFIEDGCLNIRPTLTEERIGEANVRSGFRYDGWGGSPADACTGNNFYGCERTSGGSAIINPIQSAKLTTIESFSLKYGRVEVRAKIPRGDWLWPAVWLLPKSNEFGNWPASGEIDLLEARGNPSWKDAGNNCYGSTLHWGPSFDQNRFPLTTKVFCTDKPLSDDFHVYGLVWREDGLFTYIDNEDNVVLKVDMSKQRMWEFGDFPSWNDDVWRNEPKNAPFNREYYLLINLAVGGVTGFFDDDMPNKPWSNDSPQSALDFYNAKNQWYSTWDDDASRFKIDYVKAWRFI